MGCDFFFAFFGVNRSESFPSTLDHERGDMVDGESMEFEESLGEAHSKCGCNLGCADVTVCFFFILVLLVYFRAEEFRTKFLHRGISFFADKTAKLRLVLSVFEYLVLVFSYNVSSPMFLYSDGGEMKSAH